MDFDMTSFAAPVVDAEIGVVDYVDFNNSAMEMEDFSDDEMDDEFGARRLAAGEMPGGTGRELF